MILADTSVWVDHLRRGDADLVRLLHDRQILTHPFVTGEIALGSLKQRKQIIDSLRDLPQAAVAEDHEVLAFIDRHGLFGLGIGYIDAHLLASTHLTPGTTLWTRDRRLRESAERMAVAARLPD